ncbi:hypothetical protein [Reyranella sp.]|uniref:hypothetical protein n=1 Tax=Reyranella sp. TaxID=1929291 RepID=UPI00272F6F78|nr:hypothetical protein [Reyranella sp.]MDP2377629.1 hypothetical protein [Reyranella sp.]
MIIQFRRFTRSTFQIVGVVIAFPLTLVALSTLSLLHNYVLLAGALIAAVLANKWLRKGSAVSLRVAGVLSCLFALIAIVVFLGAPDESKDTASATTGPNAITAAQSDGKSNTPKLVAPVSQRPEGRVNLIGAEAKEASILVPSDPNARYFLLSTRWTSTTVVEVLTKREGKSGVSYSLREVDCAKRRFRYLGEGDTAQEALLRKSADPSMGPLTQESISTYVSNFACSRTESLTVGRDARAGDAHKGVPPARSPVDDYMERLGEANEVIQSLKYGAKDLVDITPEKLILLVSLFDGCAQLYERGGALSLASQQEAIRQTFKKNLSRKQSEAFPPLRDAFGPAMRKKLWIADGTAKTFGPGFKTVEFSSAAFAANRNIQSAQERMHSTLLNFRFSRIQYKWADTSAEHTYFKLEAPKDGDLVIWTGDTFKIQ